MRALSTIIFAVIIAFGTVAVSPPSQAKQKMTKDQLLGTWQLVSLKTTTGDQVGYPLGKHPGGYVGFTPTRFWAMLVDTTRKAPTAAALTDVEAVSLMKSSAAYTGRYDLDPVQTLDGMKITIHVDAAANQALTGIDRVFFFYVDGNKLKVKSPSALIPTTGLKSAVELEYVKVD